MKKNLKTLLFIAILSLYTVSFFAQIDKRDLFSKPVAELQKLADNNDAEAQYWLSIRYRYNYERGDVIIDKKKGLYWLQIATDNNNNLAMQETLKINLGSFIPVQKNEAEKIFAWSKEKFESSNAEDQKEVADIFYVKELYDKAMYWYQKGADKDFASSQYELSKMYGLGIGTKADKKLAKYWKKRANSLDGTNYDLAKVEKKRVEEAEKEENARFEARMQNLYKNENIIKNESFVKGLIPELQKTEQAVSRKIKENDAAFRGTTVEAEEAKAQRDAAFYAASERLGFDTFNTSGTTSSSNSSSSNTSNNSSSSNGANSSNSSSNSSSGNSDSKSKTASSNDANTKNNNSGTTSNNSLSSNTGTSNSSSGTTSNNVSNGSNSSTSTSNNNSTSNRSVLTLTVVDHSKEDAEAARKQQEADLRQAEKNKKEAQLNIDLEKERIRKMKEEDARRCALDPNCGKRGNAMPK